MNRCTARIPCFLSQRGTLACLALLLSVSAWAQMGLRSFPSHAQRALMQIMSAPELRLDGVMERLSPGARIYGRDNLILMPDTLAGRAFLVNYVREPSGQIYEVWILSDAEAAQARPIGP